MEKHQKHQENWWEQKKVKKSKIIKDKTLLKKLI